MSSYMFLSNCRVPTSNWAFVNLYIEKARGVSNIAVGWRIELTYLALGQSFSVYFVPD